jgi:hypothetical protein
MSRIIFTFIIALLCGVAYSQTNGLQPDETDSAMLPRHVLKFSPFHLLNFYPTVQLAYERHIYKEWTLQFDAGIAVSSNLGGFENEDLKNKKGYKLKIEPHYNFFIDKSSDFLLYGATEFYFNHIRFDHSNTQTECFDESCIDRYERTYRYRATYEESGVALKIGIVRYVGRFLLDTNVGIGIRSINYTLPSYIKLQERRDLGLDIPRIEDRVAFTPIFNLRFGYKID